MATKKYVSLEKLGLYDEKLKIFLADADTAALKSAKDYTDESFGLANENAASLANTAEANAKAYADGKDAAIQAAQKAADDAAAAAATADGKAVAAQGEVDALEALVGVLPEGTTATTVVDYVNKKTEGIATDAALGELNSQVSGLQTAVQGIQADYLKTEHKTALEGQISAVQTAVDTEKSRAEGIESGLRTDVDAIKADYLKTEHKTALENSIADVAGDVTEIAGDYLKAEDKTELQGKIDAKVAQTDYDAKMEEIDGDIDGLQTQINTIMNNPDAEGAINSINEFTAYVTEHGAIADGFRTDINKNKDDIAVEVKRAGEAEAALAERLDVLEDIDHDAYVAADEVLAGRIKTLEDIDHDAYIDADTALKNELNGEIAKKADASALTSAVEALQGADSAMAGRLDTIEAQLGDGEGSVADMIADAKQEAIDSAVGTAAADATQKANAAESAAKGHADSLNTAMNTRVEALEAIDHEHSNKALLDTYTQTEANLADAVAKKHQHSNFEVLEGITSDKVTAWDAAEQNAKTHANGLNTAMDTRVTAIETWHSNFVEVSEQEINDLFA